MILILRGHIRSAFNDDQLYQFLKSLPDIEIYIHTWSVFQASLSWRTLEENNTPVTNEVIIAYFRDIASNIKHIIIDDDNDIKLTGSTDGILIPGQCPIPRIAWKNYWYGKYKIAEYIKERYASDSTVINTRFDFFQVNQSRGFLLDFSNEILLEFIKKNTITKNNCFLKDETFQGLDNFYIGPISSMYRIAHHFHFNLDTILQTPLYKNIGHWEYIVYYENKRLNLPKKIWILWYQGIDNAHLLTHQVLDTWKVHNPSWEVIILNEQNIRSYIDFIPFKLPQVTYQLFSDFVRVNILKKHGGVWADATMACLRPLDSWIYDAIEPVGFWMYHGRDNGRGPASWFMISIPESYIISTWADTVNEFLIENDSIEFYWLDRLFSILALNNPDFLNDWKKVPYLWCEDSYNAHFLCGKCDHYNPDIVTNILAAPHTFAVKLNNHFKFHEKTNAWLLLEKALLPNITEYPKVKWDTPPSFENADFFSVHNY